MQTEETPQETAACAPASPAPWRRAVDDVVAARLSSEVQIAPFFTGFVLPSDNLRSLILAETIRASAGTRGAAYTESVHIILEGCAALRANMTGEDPKALYVHLEKSWARYLARRS